MNIIHTPSPNFNERPSGIDAIIIHYTDMISAEDALAWLTNPASKVSAHYLIAEGGQIYQIVDEKQRAWHAGESYWQGLTNLNDCSIGIELANLGHSHGYQPFPNAQIASLIELCLEIKARWDIPASRILGHSDIAPQRKQDPGHLFPWERLAAEGLGMWPGHYTDGVIPAKEGCSEKVMLQEDVTRLRHPREGGDPVNLLDSKDWVPAFAGMTQLGSAALPFPNYGDDATCAFLATIGYDVTSPTHALAAFQRHFQPHKVDGVADHETTTLLNSLLNAQKMLI